MSDRIRVKFAVPRKVAFGVTCLVLGGAVCSVGSSFADNLTSTSTVASGDLILPYDGFLMSDSSALSGPVQMKFELYESLGGTTAEWTEEQTVNVFNGRFSVGLGSVNSINATILDAEKLWLAIIVLEDDGMGGTVEVPLSGRQAIEPAPYAAWAANSADFNIDGDLDVAGRADISGALLARGTVTLGDTTADTVTLNGETTINGGPTLNGDTTINGETTINDDVRPRGIKPQYSAWSTDTGAGGAGIVNDNVNYQALMIVGNDADPAHGTIRRVEMYDDVQIERDLAVTRDANVTGRVRVGSGVIQRGGATITSTTNLGLYSRVANDGIRFVTNNGPFAWFNDNGAGTQQDMALNNGDLVVRNNVTVGGKIIGLTDAGNQELNSNSDVSLGISTADGMCFLTKVRFDHNERDPDPMRCEVYPSGGVWRMANSENSGSPQRADADCKARCILY